MTDPDPSSLPSSSPVPVCLDLADEAATAALGAALAGALTPGLKIYLHGPLGAGKTSLVRALLRARGFGGKVRSPTYTLVELYSLSRLNLYHFDFYRFRDSEEWRDAGFSEYFNADGICLVEWPEKAAGSLPPADLDITLHHIDDEAAADAQSTAARRVVLQARTPSGQQCLKGAIQSLSLSGSS
jgi:tRNA threonylcarbamoyladenosine biosynthesis protein TsaE